MDKVEKLNLLNKTIENLDKAIKSGRYDYLHDKYRGIRSSQIAALIEYLIDNNIIKE